MSAATEALLAQRKLFGVLDLDHTLLHTTKDARASAYLENEPDLFEIQVPLPADTVASYYVKLRPGLKRFLDVAVQLFDLHIYTMGSRAYADAVVSLFDSEHLLVQQIVSREEGEPAKKSLHRLHPCDPRLVTIVDDRVDVWAEGASNIVRAHEFLYFFEEENDLNPRRCVQSSAEQNKKPHSTRHRDRPIVSHQLSSHPFPDNVLVSLAAVLEAVHQVFYSIHPADVAVPRVIRAAQETTLAGCVLVFSGVYPSRTHDGKQLRFTGTTTTHELPDAWRQALAFGALCLDDLDGDVRVTHLVAARDGSSKIAAAGKMHTDVRPAIVHISWLWHSLAHFQRGDESLFPLWSQVDSKRASPIDRHSLHLVHHCQQPPLVPALVARITQHIACLGTSSSQPPHLEEADAAAVATPTNLKRKAEYPIERRQEKEPRFAPDHTSPSIGNAEND